MAREFVLADAQDTIDLGTTTDHDFSGTSTYTIACWFKASSVHDGYLLARYGQSGLPLKRQWIFFVSNVSGNLRMGSHREVSPWNSTNSTNLSTNTWYHGAITYDGTKLTFYVDGVADGTLTIGSISSVSEDTRIGSQSSGGSASWFDGHIAEVGIWKGVALSANEIKHVMRHGPHTVQRSSLVGYYPLYGVSSTEADLSGKGHNGTATATAKSNHAPVGRNVPAPLYSQLIALGGGTALSASKPTVSAIIG